MLDILQARRSIRVYEEKSVEQEKIDALIKGALLSPSSRARRPWEFVVVTDQEVLQTLSKSREFGSQILAGAPLGIVVLADPQACDVWVEDASIAAIIIQLTAQSLGLGSCWIQVRERFHAQGVKSEDFIKEAIGAPAGYSVECIISIGYPAEDKKPYADEDLLYNKVHYNKYK